MKKFILVILVMALGFFVNQKLNERKREKLVGVWASEQKIKGGWCRVTMNLKPEGELLVSLDGNVNGRPGYWQSSGRWELKNSKLSMHLSSNGIPIYKVGEEYGGKIVSLEEKKLSCRHDTGVDTWTRLR